MSRVDAIWRIRLDPRAERTESVEALAAGPLAVSLLQVARGHVVRRGIAEDEVAGIFCTDPAAALGDDDGEFRFMFDLVRLWGQYDGFTRADDRRGWFEKEQGQIGHFGVVLFGVGDVVAAHANDLPWGDRRKQVYGVDRQRGFLAAKLVERLPVENADALVGDPTPKNG
jgi:hypothetical protein